MFSQSGALDFKHIHSWRIATYWWKSDLP